MQASILLSRSILLSLLITLSSCSFLGISEKFYLFKKQFIQVELAPGESKEDHQAQGANYMVSSQGKNSSMAGKKMFELGGNIVDAALAVSFTLAVERPHSTGIGGGGFLLYLPHDKLVPVTVDFREKAPLAAKKDMYVDSMGSVMPNKSLDGIFSVGVPGFVAGLTELHEQYGELSLLQILKPAIDLADKGFEVYPELEVALKKRESVLKSFKASKKIFFNKKGKVLKKGDLLVQRDLARTLEQIALSGRSAFYKGEIPQKIVDESRSLGGLLSMKDFTKYNVKYRDPIVGTYKGYKIFSMSPPSSGGAHIVQILNILEKDKLYRYGPHHEKTVHLMSSAMQVAFADRAAYMGDSDFVDVPLDVILLKKYARDRRYSIPESRALRKILVSEANIKKYRPKYEKPYVAPKKELAPEKKIMQEFNPYRKMRETSKERIRKSKKPESSETTHFTIMDSKGNVISSTQTINGYFGSGVIVPGTGILLNNEMDDFAAGIGAKNLFGAVGGRNNLIAPEKRPLSSMSPTIIVKNDKPVLALGSPSGTRILTCVAQTIMNVIEHKVPLYESVAMARYHHQWDPDEIRIDKVGLPSKTIKALKSYGHQIKFKDLGCRVQAIARENDKLIGVSDPRGYGKSVGE